MAAPLDLTPERVSSMAPGRFFRDTSAPIVSLDFHRTEDLLVVAAADESLHLYDTAAGTLVKTLFAKTYGVSRVACTHAPLAVLTASGANRSDHDVRYHSLYDNTYLRFFKGHTARVLSLNMSPKSDAFLTTSQDGSARLWDVRTNVCSGALRCTTASPVAAFDHQGLVFAVVTSDGVTKLFDARQYEQGPFDTYVFDAGVPAVRMPASASSVSFSLDGKQLLVCAGGHLHVMDAFNGQRLQCLPVPSSNAFGVNAAPLCEPCFTPDGRCVLSGAADGLIHGWNTASGVELQPPWRGHAGVPCCLKWSYSRALAASGCTAGGVALWIPPPPATEGHVGGAPQGLMQQAAQFPGQTGGLMAAMQPVMQQGGHAAGRILSVATQRPNE